MIKEKILVVDDEIHIAELLAYNLESNGYEVIVASDGLEAIALCEAEIPNLVLLDIMLPGIDGFEVCKRIKQDVRLKEIPIIMLTAKSEEFDTVLGLELGADDYLSKPFSIRELVARVRAVLRRRNVVVEDRKSLKFKDLEVNLDLREVRVLGKKIELTLKEFELLDILIRNKGKILSREQLLESIWGYEYIGETRTVDVHIRYLRKKIEINDKNPIYIETVRGVGYRFNPEL